MNVASYLARNGGVMPRSKLISCGITDVQLARALRTGLVTRPRRGWYASSTSHPDILRAVAVGGRLSCTSALRARGIWVPPDDDLHVSVPHGSQRSPRRGVRLHWRRLHSASIDDHPVESVLEALEQAFHCGPRVLAVIVADSALNLHLVTREQLVALFGGSQRGRWVLAHLDPACQSGIETIARLALARLGVRFASQVSIAGVGRVDLLIGDRLILELDGRSWHDTTSTFEADRKRDLDLLVRGYLVVRVSYRRVLEDWPAVESDLRTLIRRREHLATARHAKVLGMGRLG